MAQQELNFYEKQDQIRKDADKAKQEIANEYGAFFTTLDFDPDYELPDKARERFQYFINTAPKYLFCSIKEKFLLKAGSEDNAPLIKAEIFALNSIVKHERLENEKEKLKLLTAATNYISEVNQFGIADGKWATSDEEATLYIYILFQQNYFEHYLMPHEFFIIEGTAENYIFFSETYARYFWFYNYLLERANALKINLTDKETESITPTKQEVVFKPSRKEAIKRKTLRGIWGGSDSDWERAINFLQKPYKKDGLPWVSIDNKGELKWTKSGRKLFQKYLAGFIRVCVKCKFIENNFSGPEIASICCNTFPNLGTLERSNFAHLDFFSELDEYQMPFLDLIGKTKK